MKKRPLVCAAAAYALGALLGLCGWFPACAFYALSAASGVWFFLRRGFIPLFAALFFLAAGGAAVRSMPATGGLGDDLSLSGRVCEAPAQKDFYQSVLLADAVINGEAANGRVRLSLYGDASLQAGDTVSLTADVFLPKGRTNPGGFDYEAWLARRGIKRLASGNAKTLTVTPGGGASSPLATLRERLGAALTQMFGANAPIARGLVMGDKSDLPEDVYADFQNSGTAHLLAVSGLHVSILAKALFWLLCALRLNRSRAFWAVTALLIVYSALSGFTASALRATAMFFLLELARQTGRPSDALTRLAAAFLLLTAWNPLMVTDPGLMLSFSAVLGIVLLLPTLTALIPKTWRKNTLGKWFWGALSISTAAQLGVLPGLCCLYGTLSAWSIFASVLAVFLCSMLLPLLLGAALLAMLLPSLAVVWAFVPNVLLTGLTHLTAFASDLPGARLIVPAWPIWLVALYAAAAFFASPYARALRRRKALLLPALPALLALSVLLARLAIPPGLAILFLDAGQGDAMVVSAQGKTYLVDVGRPGSPTDDYLRHSGRGVDGVFLSHAHDDHAGGLEELLECRDVPVFYLPECWPDSSEDAAAALTLIRAAGAQTVYLKAGDALPLSADVSCEVLYPEAGTKLSGNDASMVLRLTCGEGSALLTGDLPAKREPADIPPTRLLKAPHHGSKHAAGEAFLSEVAPEVCVISVGHNSYGHPAPELLKRLEALGCTVLRTDESGAVLTRIGKDGRVETETYLP